MAAMERKLERLVMADLCLMMNAETTVNSDDLPHPMKLPTAAPWLAASNTQLLDQQTPQFLTQDFQLGGFGEGIVHSGPPIPASA